MTLTSAVGRPENRHLELARNIASSVRERRFAPANQPLLKVPEPMIPSRGCPGCEPRGDDAAKIEQRATPMRAPASTCPSTGTDHQEDQAGPRPTRPWAGVRPILSAPEALTICFGLMPCSSNRSSASSGRWSAGHGAGASSQPLLPSGVEALSALQETLMARSAPIQRS